MINPMAINKQHSLTQSRASLRGMVSRSMRLLGCGGGDRAIELVSELEWWCDDCLCGLLSLNLYIPPSSVAGHRRPLASLLNPATESYKSLMKPMVSGTIYPSRSRRRHTSKPEEEPDMRAKRLELEN
ncbi:hypothetical protein CIB48_g8262 [Xylaria polymorpha]|nr:hypothetical protein CIB48_g8262 [Xylaria polymorpha]